MALHFYIEKAFFKHFPCNASFINCFAVICRCIDTRDTNEVTKMQLLSPDNRRGKRISVYTRISLRRVAHLGKLN